METTKTNTRAAERYAENRDAIAELLGSIRDGLDAHAGKFNGRNWGFVGDLESIRATLRDLSDRLNGSGEYAERRFRD